ncbi:hypothetical protein M0R45_000903 [Rubus argutus]|uniref:Helitron helicase-like domain-containing protein n=1 Tax=Rubus argutus TaxID=59490 RepID=A0AAW1VJE7_RUBAR
MSRGKAAPVEPIIQKYDFAPARFPDLFFARQGYKRKRTKITSAVDSNSDASMSNNVRLENTVPCGNNIGQASFQRGRCEAHNEYLDIGDMIHVCSDCNALFWLSESKKNASKRNPPIHTKCCREGRIKLQAPHATPPFLEKMLDPNNGRQSILFKENIRAYNSMFAFTSIGAKIDQSINDGSGPYVFNISGQVHHLMGSLLPPEHESPKFGVYRVPYRIMNWECVLHND